MVSRGRRPGLFGRTAQTVARTAVIAGTATAVSGAVARRQAGAAQPDSPVTPPPPSGLSNDVMDQLKRLGELRASGVLTEDEFAAQKARLLG